MWQWLDLTFSFNLKCEFGDDMQKCKRWIDLTIWEVEENVFLLFDHFVADSPLVLTVPATLIEVLWIQSLQFHFLGVISGMW